MSNYNQEKSIIQIMDDLKRQRLLLPEFQREYRWPIEKAEILFDSLIQNLFIGSIIISKPTFDLACKQIDGRPRGSKRHRPKSKEYTAKEFETKNIYALLDGQQRITSIYRVLEGTDRLHLVLKSKADLIHPTIYNIDKREIVTDEIYDLIYDIDSKDVENNVAMPIDKIYYYNCNFTRDTKIIEEFLQPIYSGANIPNTDWEFYNDICLFIIQQFGEKVSKKETLLSVQLLDLDIEKFCLYFERSNSQGMTLTFTDIVTAKVYTKFKLGNAIREAQQNYSGTFNENLVDGLIRYINFKANGEVTKSSILQSIRGDHFNLHWDSTVKDLSYIQDWLKDQSWLFDLSSLTYKIMLFPMLSFYQNLKPKDLSSASPDKINQLKLWFYCSLITHRYGGGAHGSTNVVVKTDLGIFKDLAITGKIKSTYWDSFSFDISQETFIRLDHNRSAQSIGWSMYLYNCNIPKNFHNSTNVDYNKEVDIHHIYPIGYIKDKFSVRSDEYDVADSFLNKTRINKIPNIRIGKKSPGNYCSEIFAINAKLTDSLATHYFDDIDGILQGGYDHDFMGFLNLRYTKMRPYFERLKNNLDSCKQGNFNNIKFD